MKVLLGAAIILGGLFMTTNSYADALTLASSTTANFNPLAHTDNVKACPFAKHTGTLFSGGAKTQEEAKLNLKDYQIGK